MDTPHDKERSRYLSILSEAVEKAGGILYLKERTKVRYDFLGCQMETTVVSIRPTDEVLWGEPGFTVKGDVTTHQIETEELKRIINCIIL